MNMNGPKRSLLWLSACGGAALLTATNGAHAQLIGGGTNTDVCRQDTANNVACGAISLAGAGATAVGNNADANATDAVAIGFNSGSKDLGTAVGADAVAWTGATAIGLTTRAMGTGDFAAGANAWSGNGSGFGGNGNIALGSDSQTVDGASTGVHTFAYGGDTVAIGTAAQAVAARNTALGGYADANGVRAVAIGADTSVTGWGQMIGGAYVGNVAIGYNSSDGGDSTRNVVSVGNASLGISRVITNVSNGVVSATSTDAVTGQQLYAINQQIAALAVSAGSAASAGNALPLTGGNLTGGIGMGGNTITGLASGTITAGSTDAVNGGDVYSFVTGVGGTAASAQATADTALARTQYIAVNGSGAAPSATGAGAVGIGTGQTANGNGAVAIGDPNSAIGTGGVAVGANNTANGSGAVALGDSNPATAGSQAIGESNMATGASSVALGTNNQALAAGSVAIGSHATVQLGASNAVALGEGSVADAADTVSVGSAGSQRRVTHVAAGTVSATSSDAVTGAQVYAQAQSVASALGGGSTVAANGTVTAPTYHVQGSDYSSVDGALAALDKSVTATGLSLQNLQSQVLRGLRVASGGTAMAIAAGNQHYSDQPGKLSVAVGAGLFNHQTGVSGGFGYTAKSGAWRVNGSFALSPSYQKTPISVGMGASWVLN